MNVTLINSIVGGNVDLSQSCSANGTCMFSVAQASTADVQFKAANATSAKDAGSWFTGLFHADISNTSSYQSINEQIRNGINEACNVQSIDSINNVNIFAENSQIGGNLAITQQGTSTGSCSMQAAMNASAIASGVLNNCSMSGKKKSCSGKGSGLGEYIGYAIIGLIVLAVAFGLAKAFAGTSFAGTSFAGTSFAGGKIPPGTFMKS